MKKPRILFYDIETRPNLAYVWAKYEQDVIAFKEEWEMLSVAYSWGGEAKVYCLTREGEKSDKKLAIAIHHLFGEADVIVAHNGNDFDQKKVRARMIFHDLTPPKTPAAVDTLMVARRYFKFNGNSLGELVSHLKLGKKPAKQDFDMWLGCMANNSKAWDKMSRYNKNDVVLLKRVYSRFRPWISDHPNLNLLRDPKDRNTAKCPVCSSSNVQKRGFRVTARSVGQTYQCQHCAKWFQLSMAKDVT